MSTKTTELKELGSTLKVKKMIAYTKNTAVGFVVCGLLFGFLFYITSVDDFEFANLTFSRALDIYKDKGPFVQLMLIPIIVFLISCLNDDIDNLFHFKNIVLSFTKKEETQNFIIFLFIALICLLSILELETVYVFLFMACFYPICFISIPLQINVKIVTDQDLGKMLFKQSLVAIFIFIALYGVVHFA